MFRKNLITIAILGVVLGVGVWVFREIRVFREVGEVKIKKDLVKEKLEKMSLEQKIGQMMMVGEVQLDEGELTEAREREGLVGGIIISSKLRIGQIREIREKIATQSGVVPFIAVDQEGGVICRLDWLDCTAQRQIGDSQQAYQLAKRRGEDLADLGFNLSFAPVLDVSEKSNDFIFERVFRGDYQQVAELGGMMVKGFTDAGIVSCGKHFPGHGGTSIDSHLSLPVIDCSKDCFEEVIYPYKVVIKEDLPMIMVGHLKYEELSEESASLSKEVIEGVLRKDLGFEGVVITDDLLMGAVSRCQVLDEQCRQDVVDNSLRAIKAGVDMVMVTANGQIQEVVYNRLLEAVKNGEISEKRINQSVERIVRLKSEYLGVSI